MSHMGGRSTGWQRAARANRSREETIFSAFKFIKLGMMNSITRRGGTAAFQNLA
jgi:hypothetical protein